MRWELKSLSLVVFDPLYNRMLRAHMELCTHHLPLECTFRPQVQVMVTAPSFAIVCTRDTHKMPFNLKLVYCRKTESKEKAARRSCWNKEGVFSFIKILFFLSSTNQVEEEKAYQVNSIQCHDILLHLLTLHYSLWKYPILRNKV